LNKDLNTGIIAVLLLTNPLTQKMLSAKHLLSTNTNKVEWGTEFEEYFTIDMNNIYLTDSEVYIVIDTKDIIDNEEDNDRYIKKLKIVGKRGKLILSYESPVKLLLNENIIQKLVNDDQLIKIGSKDIALDENIFSFVAVNNELTTSLRKILDLIENNEHLGAEDIDDMVNKFVELVVDNEMNIDSVHTEMIVSTLIRDSKDLTKRPDFSKEELGDYEILRVSKAILNGPVSVSLAFERILDQLTSVETYNKSNESIVDSLFR